MATAQYVHTRCFRPCPTRRCMVAIVPRDRREVPQWNGGAATAMGADAARFGLNIPLTPDDEQKAREADQLAAHCDALPG